MTNQSFAQTAAIEGTELNVQDIERNANVSLFQHYGSTNRRNADKTALFGVVSIAIGGQTIQGDLLRFGFRQC